MSPTIDPAAAVRLHQLEGFFYVGRHEGFTRAADAMPYAITEPALHQQVRKLERALGVKLLVQGAKRRMVLTPEGRALHAFVTPYFEGLSGVLRDLAGGRAGALVVGAEALYVEGLCAEAIVGFGRRASGTQVRLLELDVPTMAHALVRGDIDVGVASPGAFEAQLPDGLRFELLGSLGLELLVPAGHPLARARPPLTARHLADLRCVVYEAGSEGRAYTGRVLERMGIRLMPAAEASSAATMRALVRAGVAPAFVPALKPRGRARRRTEKDGTVAFDLTGLLEEVAGLPRFGLLRRAGPGGALVDLFCAALRERTRA